MTIYQPGIPTGFVNLDVDFQNIQNNFQQLDTTYGTDHVAYSQAENNGYHNIIHMVPINSDPAQVTGIGQLYTKIATIPPGDDGQLFFETPGGGIQQISGNHAASPNGYAWFGGILLQWGQVNGSHGSSNVFNLGDTGTVNFSTSPNVNFSTGVFAAWSQIFYNSTTAGVPASSSSVTVNIDINSLSTSGFSWKIGGSGSSFTNFKWFAIGN